MTQRDVLCFSDVRWDFLRRPANHSMVRCARERRVFYIESPIFEQGPDRLEIRQLEPNLLRVVPHLAEADDDDCSTLRGLLRALCTSDRGRAPIHWFYAPWMVRWTQQLPRSLTVYDCADELASRCGASAESRGYEQLLLSTADLIFTGGTAHYGSKRCLRPDIRLVPHGVDARFFMAARRVLPHPSDQRSLARPRIGYCGTIDERIDFDLLRTIAERQPDWQIIMLGPVARIDPAVLPQGPNIHYLGPRPYAELPSYLASWDAAIVPFALNDATRWVKPNKTLEYLAAGLGVVSTAIWDVIEPCERLGFVRIGHDADAFIRELGAVLRSERRASDAARDMFLVANSWDEHWRLVTRALDAAEGYCTRIHAVPLERTPARTAMPTSNGS